MSEAMTPEQFVTKWRDTSLRERQSYQSHFNDLCRLVGHEAPGGDGLTETGETFVYEYSLKKGSGGQGFADVYYEGHFAIEYKSPGKYKNLSDAYNQLLQYRENLNNPPLLVVTDINNWEIHTNFVNTANEPRRFSHEEIASDPEKRDWLRYMFFAPERLHPGHNTAQVTQDAAKVFRLIADNMRGWEAETERIAYFLTKLVFCLFAEDIGLLPTVPNSPQGIFSYVIEQSRRRPSVFPKYVQNLFRAMAIGDDFLMRDIPYFNGTLFKVVTVEELQQEALDELAKAAELNWEAIEPSIFGTLFERSLDPDKRSQLGAHYTSREDILRIVEPVLMQPLRYQWDTVQLEAEPIRQRLDKTKTRRARNISRNQLLALRDEMLGRLRGVTVLDPACGSGNFLYVSLQMLMDLEKEVINHPLWEGLQMPLPAVHPRQMYGIEINPIAHALASIVVWIGYIQWRSNNGYHSHFSEPILEELQGNIVCKDAILPTLSNPIPSPSPKHWRRESGRPESDLDSPADHPPNALGGPRGVDWPAVDVIVGNPPFLGGKKMRSELGDYVDRLFDFYGGRVPPEADLVCYWFERAREQIEIGRAKRAGLLATNSIRGGANREVLKRIKNTGDIFMAWSDREWILDGAAVRVSMVGFDDNSEDKRRLNDNYVSQINADLSASVDLISAEKLLENSGIAFMGVTPAGKFDMPITVAQEMIKTDTRNLDVLRPFYNAKDITSRPRDAWTIDFGTQCAQSHAQTYDLPYRYLLEHVYEARQQNRRERYRNNWWIYAESRPGMRTALDTCCKYILTPRVSKYRVFTWLDVQVLPDSATIAIARDDDYFFGVLHSKPHEVWSLRMGTWLGKGNDPRYTPTTTFETFPLPWSPGAEDKSHPAHAAISHAAKQLHEERDAWLNPLGVSEKQLKDHTLTNLYNALQVFRERDSMKTKPAAANFAPRLDELHRGLDEAVCDTYGWEYAILDDEEEILRRLLALNLARAGV